MKNPAHDLSSGASSISRSCPGNVPSLCANTLVGAGVGAGESMPITNKTDEGRAENRRFKVCWAT